MKKIYILLVLVCLTTSSLFAQLIINEVLYDPSNSGLAGDANGDGVYSQTQDEFIEFVNDGWNNLDVSGYQIWDDTTTGTLVYTIPGGTIIPPKGALVVFGGGTPVGSFGGALVLADTGVSGLNLNNSGEIIIIKDAKGKVLLSYDTDALSDNPNESYTRNPDIIGAFEQHNDNTPLLFSPGTKIDGSPFDTTLAVNVSFSVDMTAYTGSFTGVFVNGTFNGWCGGCNPMTDDNGDGVWELTIPLTADSIEFKFSLDGATTWESFAGGEACTKTTGGFTNRFGIISGTTSFATACFNSCEACKNIDLQLKGIMDFTTPAAGVAGKAIHVKVDKNIPNLNIYGIGVANNGGGTDGQEYTFPNIAVTAGTNILVVRDSQALADYFGMCWSAFDLVLIDPTGNISQNGDDAIELFRANAVVETFGDINKDGTGLYWDYEDAWAYKADTGWVYATPNCTDGTTTMYDADCRYPICPSILATSIVVEGEDDATTITTKSGTLQMIATLMPANADDSTVTWSVNNPAIGTIDSSGLLTAVNNGDVIVTATANDGSGIFGTKTITISNQSTGSVNNAYKSSITIYPNPAENKLAIVSNYNISQVNILTISGQLIHAQKIVNGAVDISNLESGIYFVEVQINDSWSRHKIIKK
jgi:uncharacterized protein YjdB